MYTINRKGRFATLRRRWLILLPLLLVVALAASACAAGVSEERVADLEAKVQSLTASAGKVAEPTRTRHFYVTAAEIKGYTSGIDPPTVNPKDLSDGYGFYPAGTVDPARPQRWGVAAYFWMPGSMIAYQGDKVSLTIIILNGDNHETWIEDPSGNPAVQETDMNRGREYKLSFTATKAGTYKLICNEHGESMTAYIQVLPRS